MASTCVPRYAAALLLAAVLFSAASFAARVLTEDQPETAPDLLSGKVQIASESPDSLSEPPSDPSLDSAHRKSNTPSTSSSDWPSDPSPGSPPPDSPPGSPPGASPEPKPKPSRKSRPKSEKAGKESPPDAEERKYQRFEGDLLPAKNPKLSYKDVNRLYADGEAQDLAESLPCATWAALTWSTRIKMQWDKEGIVDEGNAYAQYSHNGGVSLDLYQAGWPMSVAGCKTIKKAAKQGYTSGGEWVLELTGKEYVSVTVALWRRNGTTAMGTRKAAKEAIATAAQTCISEQNLPVGNLTLWPPCIGRQLIATPEDAKKQPKESYLTYIVALSEEVVDTLVISPKGTNQQSDLGIVRTTLSLSNEGITKKITFLGLRM